MDRLECVDTLLQVDVVRGQLGLAIPRVLAVILTSKSDRGSIRTLSSAWPNCSLVYWKVREANGVICPPRELCKLNVSHESKAFFPDRSIPGLEASGFVREALLETFERVHIFCSVSLGGGSV